MSPAVLWPVGIGSATMDGASNPNQALSYCMQIPRAVKETFQCTYFSPSRLEA